MPEVWDRSGGRGSVRATFSGARTEPRPPESRVVLDDLGRMEQARSVRASGSGCSEVLPDPNALRATPTRRAMAPTRGLQLPARTDPDPATAKWAMSHMRT